MNEEQLRGNWNQIKGKLKQKYGELTEDDLQYAEGKSDELLGRLQEKTGKAKSELIKEIESF
ncbi:CsbD family protein [uncultured Planktosalinus sp.]|uniref:CsbD family protein n=1 Tax=uncultured Planktosalinus sp. TaxID=1810935 RepID=UPI0030D85CD2